MVSFASAGLSCGQASTRFLAGFSISCQLLCYCWRQPGHGPDGCQWNDLLRSFQTIHVYCCIGVEPLPCETPCCVDCDLGHSEFDIGIDAAEPSSDIQGQRRTTSRSSPCTRAQCWLATPGAVALRRDSQSTAEGNVVVGSLDL